MKYTKTYVLLERYRRSKPVLTLSILPPILTTIFFDFHCKDEEMRPREVK